MQSHLQCRSVLLSTHPHRQLLPPESFYCSLSNWCEVKSQDYFDLHFPDNSENWTYYLRTQLYHSGAQTQEMLQHVIRTHVHTNLIYNNQKLERNQMSLNGGMDTENVVYLHNGVLFSN